MKDDSQYWARNYGTEKCASCGEIFVKHKKAQRCCSRRCSLALRNYGHEKAMQAAAEAKPQNFGEASCALCGQAFIKKTPVQRFCSRICAGKDKTRRTMEYKAMLEEHPETCPICGNQFVKSNPTQKYCGRKCAGRAVAARTKAYRAANKGKPKMTNEEILALAREKSEKKRAAMETAKCAWCGQEFLKTQKSRKYCSKQCGTKFNSAVKAKKYYAMRDNLPEGNKAATIREMNTSSVTVLVIKDVPVFQELKPLKGARYEAELKISDQNGTEIAIIPSIGRLGLILRAGEYVVVERH